MNFMKVFFLQFYQLHKNDFWLVNCLNVATGVVFYFFDFNFLIETSVIFLMFMKTLYFVKSSSVMPSVSSDFDRFSWKYLQSLPLSKSELLLSLSLINAFTTSTGVIWFLSFARQLSAIWLIDDVIKTEGAVKIAAFMLVGLVVVGFLVIKQQIIYPRKQYSKNEPRLVYWKAALKTLISLTIIINLFLFGRWFFENVHSSKFILTFIILGFKNLFSWWGILPLSAYAIWLYGNTLKTWQNEKIGYLNIEFQPRRDFSIVGGCLVMILLPFQMIKRDASGKLGGPPLHEAVYKGDFAEVSKLIVSGIDVNKPNKHGISPVHVAAFQGNLQIYQLLESHKADITKIVRSESSPHYDGFDVLKAAIERNHKPLVQHILNKDYDLNRTTTKRLNSALHFASSKCKTDLLDMLILKGANVNQVNAEGKTPLHLAAGVKCFGSVTSLIEAQADTQIQDQNGRMAIDVIPSPNINQDIFYYLEKKSRAPASK